MPRLNRVVRHATTTDAGCATDQREPTRLDPHGSTPLHDAVLTGHESCVEILLTAPDIDVNQVANNGGSVLVCPSDHVINSCRQVGMENTTCILVRLLGSRRVGSQVLTCPISLMQEFWLSNTQVAEIEDSRQVLPQKQEELTRLLLPVLWTQSTGERW